MAFVIWSILFKSAVVQIKKFFSALKIFNLKNKLDGLHKYQTVVPIESSPNISNDPSFREEIICPVCLETPLPSIYVCHIGHHACMDCRSKILLCSKCHKPFRESNTRNFTPESSIVVSYNECPCQNLHSQVGPFEKKIKDHEINCEYMSIICPLIGRNNCSENTLKISEIKQHLCNQHNENIHPYSGVRVRYKLDMQAILEHITEPYIIEFDGNIFLVKMQEHFPEESLFCFCITRLGKIVENRKYGFKVTFQGMLHSIQWKTKALCATYVSVGFICNLSDFIQNICVYNSWTGVHEIIIIHQFYEIKVKRRVPS